MPPNASGAAAPSNVARLGALRFLAMATIPGAAVTPGTVAMAKKRKSPKRATLDGDAAPDAFGGNEKVRRAEIKTAAEFFEPFL